MEHSRTVIATAVVGLGALLAILALWSAIDTEACAASDLDLASCQAAVDGR